MLNSILSKTILLLKKEGVQFFLTMSYDLKTYD